MNRFCAAFTAGLLVLLFSTPAFSQQITDIGNGNNFYCYQTDEARIIARADDDSSVSRRRALRESTRGIIKNRRLARRARRRLGDLELAAFYKSIVVEWKHTRRDIRDCWRERRDYLFDSDDNNNGGGGGETNACSSIANPSAASLSQVSVNSSDVFARIINGAVCSVGNTPVVEVLLKQNGSTVGGCTGTVVGSRCVITASHCLDGAINGADIVTGSKTVAVSSLHSHPDWDGNQSILEYNDVAILKTASDIGTNIAKVNGSNNLVVGETAIIAGYGLDENGNSGTLRAVTVKIGNQTNSRSIHTTYTSDESNLGNGNTCNGDSGGPIFVQRGSGEWYLVGDTSNGVLQNCGVGDDSYYANILDQDNVDFINTHCPGTIN